MHTVNKVSSERKRTIFIVQQYFPQFIVTCQCVLDYYSVHMIVCIGRDHRYTVDTSLKGHSELRTQYNNLPIKDKLLQSQQNNCANTILEEDLYIKVKMADPMVCIIKRCPVYQDQCSVFSQVVSICCSVVATLSFQLIQ